MAPEPAPAPQVKPVPLKLSRRHARMFRAVLSEGHRQDHPFVTEHSEFLWKISKTRELSQEDDRALSSLGIFINFSNDKSSDFWLDSGFLQHITGNIPLTSFSATFGASETIPLAAKSALKAGALMMACKFVIEFSQKPLTEAIHNIVVAIGNFPPIALVGEHPIFSLIGAATLTLPSLLIYKIYKLAKETAKQAHARLLEENRIETVPLKAGPFAMFIDEWRGLCRNYWKKAALIAASATFVYNWANADGIITAVSRTWKVLSTGATDVASAIFTFGWGVPAVLLGYGLFKMYIEKGRQEQMQKETQ